MGCCSSRQLRPSRHASESSLVSSLRPPEPPVASAPIAAFHSPTAGAFGARRTPLPLNQRFNQPIQRFVKPWTSSRPRTKREIDRDRTEFWETRVTGREEIWNALRLVVDMMEVDMATAQEIVNASGITVPTGDLTKGVYDEQGNVYLIPKFCLSYPINIIEEAEGSNHEENAEAAEMAMQAAAAFTPSLAFHKGEPFAAELEHTLTARLSNQGGHDVQVHFNSNDTVRTIRVRIAEKENIDLGSTKLTMAFLGKILYDDKTLFAQGWKEGYVVNVLITPRS